MRVGMMLNYSGGFTETVSELADFSGPACRIVFVPEAYSYRRVSQLGFIVRGRAPWRSPPASSPIYSRTPALTAMTAAGLDFVSGGRFTLVLGTSGPQVIEGWHGVPYDAPGGPHQGADRDLPYVWRASASNTTGGTTRLPLDGGTGLVKPLKLINHPVRDRIPIVIAALGPKNVALAAELAEGWQPIFYFPEKAGLTWDAPLAEGRARRDVAALGELDVIAAAPLAIGDDVAQLRDLTRPVFALLHRRHGRPQQELLLRPACRFGYEDEAKRIQDAYLSGRKDEAASPSARRAGREDLALGPHGYVKERLAAYREAGVTTLNVTALAPNPRAPGQGHRDDPRPGRGNGNSRPAPPLRPRQAARCAPPKTGRALRSAQDRPRAARRRNIVDAFARHSARMYPPAFSRAYLGEDNSKKNSKSIIPNGCLAPPAAHPAASGRPSQKVRR